MKLLIRSIATLKDLEAVNGLLCNAFRLNPSQPLEKAFLTLPNIHCFVAEYNGEIIGTASIHLIQKTNRIMGLIEDVVILPESQGKGIGKALLQHLITTSKKYGCYKIILNCSKKNMKFYEKQGFISNEIQMIIRH
ncbi:MAG: GNAT family N-acetyltransferase [Flavobacteriaceae bacterium]|nr:GNAT family N-acetyltransferase [Flavobacteriaceae bacterium]